MSFGGRRFAILALGWMLITGPAAAYYHYIHYLNRTSPYSPIPEKFDLNALPNKTLTFFVSDVVPTQYPANDSLPSVLSQIRQAISAWNGVDTSDLRVAFGGLFSAEAPMNSPAAEIVFEELPPGFLGYAGPTQKGDMVVGPNGPFIPITRSVVHLTRDLTRKPGPSYAESFFTVTVHEMGHALGLQHTYTSSTMSTSVTRTTSRVRPLEADDIAGVSWLYPSRTFAAQTGSITGRVLTGGQGVHLASVVAIRTAGTAVSALSNPDGTYRIDGLPQDQYLVYVHPLPPTADMVWPLDPGGTPVFASAPTESVFFPGTRDPSSATPVSVIRGGIISGIDFNLQRRQTVQMYDVTSYSFFNGQAVSPAYVNVNAASPYVTLVARGTGIVSGAAAAPGLSVGVLGGSMSLLPNGIRPYRDTQTNLALDFQFSPFSGTGPRHLLFTTPTDIYVLPSAINLVQKPPPGVAGVVANADGTAAVFGSNLAPDSRVYFDGLPAAARGFSGTDAAGTLVVAPPTGASNQQATVSVSNSDGQNSMFLQSQAPPTFAYGPSDPSSIVITPNALPAGTSAMVQIDGVNTRFADGQTTIGLGSSDLFVRRVFVISPTRLLLNVQVAPGAVVGAALATVISGFQVIAQPASFQILPANPRLPAITLPVANANVNQNGLFPGAVGTIFGANLTTQPNGAGTVVTVGDQQAPVLLASAGQINFVVPPTTPVGPAILRVSNGVDSAFPLVLAIENAPPILTAVLSSQNTPLDLAHAAGAGDLITLIVQGLDPVLMGAPSRVRVNESGVDIPAIMITPVSGQSGAYQVSAFLSPAISATQATISVSVDGGISSNTIQIAIR